MAKRKFVRMAPEDILMMCDMQRVLLATETGQRHAEIRISMWKHAWSMLHPQHKSRKHMIAPGAEALSKVYMESPDDRLARDLVLAVDGVLNHG